MNWLAARTLACTLEWWAGTNHVTSSGDDWYAVFSGKAGCVRYDSAKRLCYQTQHIDLQGCREMGSLGQSRCDFSPREEWTRGW